MVAPSNPSGHLYRPVETHRPHSHGLDHLSMIVSGTVIETVHGRREVAGPLSVVFKAAGVVHANAFGPLGARLLQIRIPEAITEQTLDDDRALASWRWFRDPEVSAAFLRLALRPRAKETNASENSDDAEMADLLALLSRRPALPPHGLPPRWLSELIDTIRLNPQLPGRVADIAGKAGVHPVYLARCVRRWYGHGVADELRRCRLARAVEAVALRGDSMSAVAHECGYADHPHFCRDMRQTIGVSPASLREKLAAVRFAPPAPLSPVRPAAG